VTWLNSFRAFDAIEFDKVQRHEFNPKGDQLMMAK